MYLLIYLYLAQAGALVSIPTAYTPHKQEPLFKAAGLDDSKAFYDAQQATAVLDAYVAANGLLLGENGGGSKN